MFARKALATATLGLAGLSYPEVVGAVLGAFAFAILYAHQNMDRKTSHATARGDGGGDGC